MRGSVEHFAWKSALALLSWFALVRSAGFILYFLAAAFSTLLGDAFTTQRIDFEREVAAGRIDLLGVCAWVTTTS